MRILAFDTATAATSAALCDPGAGLVIEARDDPTPSERPRHTTELMRLISDVLERAGSGWGSIDRLAVGVGPGSFTGLRIGIATARALAQAREIELVGVCTLRSLALNVSLPGGGDAPALSDTVLAVLDAGRGEVFAAGWRRDRCLIEPVALTPQALAELVGNVAPLPLMIGPGALRFRAELEPAGAIIPADNSSLHMVTAVNHCGLASGAPADADVRPRYLRLPDAELTRRAKGRQ